MNEATEANLHAYRPSGKVTWSTFLPWAAVTTRIAAGLTFGMNWLYRLGHYYIVIVPLMAGCIVAGLVILTIQLGHCRNRIVGSLVGLVAAVIVYPGSYYAGMICDFGPESRTRVDLLPKYVLLRKMNDVTHEVGHHRKALVVGQAPLEMFTLGNRMLFLQGPRHQISFLIGSSSALNSALRL